MLVPVRDRIGAATGALFVSLTIIGNQIQTSGTDQSAHPSGAAILRDAAQQAGSTSASVGFVLEILGFLTFLGFLGYVLDAGRRAGGRGGIAAGTAALAGVTMLVVKLGSAASIGALMLDRDSISPDLARVLSDMNGVGFVTSWLPYAVFVGLTAVALYQAGLVGRPTMAIGLVLGVGGLAVGLLGWQTPLDANPMAWMLGLLWTLVVSVRLAVSPGAGPSSAPEPVLAPAVVEARADRQR